ncbi:unnamed protein product [Adineta steineri]|uniref:Uncharacterized protein n=1 Tax=Adineta steineri TaxID=433720 RepID=A0A819FXH0_9BILA|nr:unnamed protein product [Adineta steineri]
MAQRSVIMFSVLSTSDQMNKIAVCFLTRIPNNELIRFANEIINRTEELDIYVMIDDNTFQLPLFDKLHFLQINNEECMNSGFKDSVKVILGKDCLSWDKALYYFCCQDGKKYDFLWLIEDDVFIPSVDALMAMNKQCYDKDYDLVCQENHYNLDGSVKPRTWDLWNDAEGKFPLPWYHSMVCAIGVSRQLLTHIEHYAKTRHFLPFIEYMFNTIAMHEGLNVYCPPELSTINFRHDWLLREIEERPMNWYHPIKDFIQQHRFRERLANPLLMIDEEETEQKQQEVSRVFASERLLDR